MRKLFFNLLKKALFVFLILMLFIPEAKALGTLQKKSYLEIKPGQTAEFSLLFWGSEAMEIELREKSVPKNWIVIIEPKKFILGNITSSEVISLQGRYVKALPVKIFAIPPEDAKPGVYEIILNMIAGRDERGISFYQEKNFNFKINISSAQEPSEIKEKKETEFEESTKSISKTGNFTIPIKEMEKIEPAKLIFWITVVVTFLLVGWRVYKL